MASHEKTVELLLALSNPARRHTRSDAVAHALRTAILLLDADAASAVLGSSKKRGERLILYAGSDTPAALPLTLGQSEAIRCLGEERQALSIADLSDCPAYAADACPGVDAGPVLFTPVEQRASTPGFLAIYRKRGRGRYTANETELMLLLSAWLSSALEALRLSAGAGTDDTSAPTPAYDPKATLRREVRRASRYAQELSVMWVEVDGLHEFRETHGDENGDGLLDEIAARLAQQVRSFDSLGLAGDERFLVVLPQTALEGAREVAERMRAAVASHAFAPAEPGQVTATIGIASFPADGLEVDALLALADRALDQARTQGRNRVGTSARKAA